jgi:hypothetical protein
MIAAISTTIADTMSQPNAIATPLMSSRKSSLFPILRARLRSAPHGLASLRLENAATDRSGYCRHSPNGIYGMSGGGCRLTPA